MMEAWQITLRLLKETWYPKPLDRDWEIKAFKAMLASIHKTLGGEKRGIRFMNTIKAYDEVIALYEQTLIDFVNSTLAKGKPLGNKLPSQ